MTTLEQTVAQNVAVPVSRAGLPTRIAEWAGYVTDLEDVAIDLGTANGSIFGRTSGLCQIEVESPEKGKYFTPQIRTVVARKGRRIIAVGYEAWQMEGRKADGIILDRAVYDGSIGSVGAYTEVFRYLLQMRFKSFRKNFRLNNHGSKKPRTLLGVPDDSAMYHRKHIRTLTEYKIKANPILYCEQIAAAIGANLPFRGHESCAIADIGGGTLDFAVLRRGQVLHKKSYRRVAGDAMDEAIKQHVLADKKHRAEIGFRTAAYIKEQIGSALPFLDEQGNVVQKLTEVVGSKTNFEPTIVTVTDEEMRECLTKQVFAPMVGAFRHYFKVLHEAELLGALADIKISGFRLVGGGSLIHRLAEYLTAEVGVPIVVTDPQIALNCVVLGAGKMLDDDDLLELARVA